MEARATSGEAFFALATAPDPGATAELLVKRGGKVSDALVAAAVPGGTVELTRPFGAGFDVQDAEGRDVLLFAAGSAIAQIRALIQHVITHRNRFGRVTLFYGQRHGAEFAYRAEHLDWERRGIPWCSAPPQRTTPGRASAAASPRSRAPRVRRLGAGGRHRVRLRDDGDGGGRAGDPRRCRGAPARIRANF